ncbi:GtrA family protein [Pseudorhodoplanes sinuspersici]|uniref:Sugar translocase n=1 Tax=Pseudorhodoplanes sinuspersici TaxID=1235591 RepID=A0A1W6ZVG3_9HYPH|nr:GtrA family protein [Pseudorhodoplanes sinuspersici]ARQ01258.1 sugar translocase [Pseudorhodoplanes sinuspersici]RKE72933.1 putative flippase GtrA [Pseudorhodoplanes sinuspersici]
MQALLQNQVVRFLLLGGLAAAINWLVRFPLSLIMPLSAAVLVAYAIGMSAGFCLYRTYVFPGSNRPMAQQIIVFLLVNLVGAVVVLALTLALLNLQGGMPLPDTIKEGLAHGVAIGIGAVVNFFGHKLLTFSVARTHRA